MSLLEHGKSICILPCSFGKGAGNPGTASGPRALFLAGLEAALQQMGYPLVVEKGIVSSSLRLTPDHTALHYKREVLQISSRIAHYMEKALQKAYFPILLGGDHSISLGSVCALSAHFRKSNESVGLIWLDAHGDMNTPETSPSGNSHGMVLAHLLGFGDPSFANLMGFAPKVSPDNVALVGVRDLDRGEKQLIRSCGIHVYTMRDIDEYGMAFVARRAVEIASNGTAGFHLSFDVDSCDPTVIPAAGTCVPGGLTFREARLFMEYCASADRLLSLDVVEFNPFQDERNQSAPLVVRLIRSALGDIIC